MNENKSSCCTKPGFWRRVDTSVRADVLEKSTDVRPEDEDAGIY
jgi:hypothetical protein